MNHLTEEQLVLYHYGDAGGGEAGAIEEHLHSCAACQAELDGIRKTLLAVDGFPVPSRSEGYGAEVWARIQPALVEPHASWWQALQSFLAPRRLAMAGAVAVVVVAAFVAGRVIPRDSRQAPGPVTGTTASAGTSARPPESAAAAATGTPAAAAQQAATDRELVRERILLIAVGDHLERSQVALVELVNNPGGAATVDISSEQERARNLVTENRLYRQAAATTGDRGVASVLDDLERVLVEIANSPSTMTEDEFSSVRKRIEQQGIIFKVRVFGNSVRERENRAVANAGIAG